MGKGFDENRKDDRNDKGKLSSPGAYLFSPVIARSGATWQSQHKAKAVGTDLQVCPPVCRGQG